MYQDFSKGHTKKEGLDPSFWTCKHLPSGLLSIYSWIDHLENSCDKGGDGENFLRGESKIKGDQTPLQTVVRFPNILSLNSMS